MVDWEKLIGKKVRLFDGVLEQERIGTVKQVSAIENAVEIDWLDRYPSSWYNLDEAEWRFDLLEVID
mgnify:CR=1 FL=1